MLTATATATASAFRVQDILRAFASWLEVPVVAEGVERESQMKYLIEHNCDHIQGYLVSKPLEEETAIRFLQGA